MCGPQDAQISNQYGLLDRENTWERCSLSLCYHQTIQKTSPVDQPSMNPNLIPGAVRNGTHCGWIPVAGGEYSRFRGIHGFGPMSDVLSAVEDSEGQAAQEIPRGKQASHRSEAESSASCEAEKENSKPIMAEPEGPEDL